MVPKLLTLLGFSSTLAFMACYGPAPAHYNEVEFTDSTEVVAEEPAEVADSTIVSE
jgi:hypothetical protein